MKKIALFGGAFDPPHLGHALCITNILNSKIVDQVWIVPSGDSRYDKKTYASATHRKEMVRLFIQDYFLEDGRVSWNHFQLEQPAEECATIDLLDVMREQYPSDQFLIVIGADNLAKVSSWRSSQRLLMEGIFIVVERLGYKAQNVIGLNAVGMATENLVHSDVSSTLIRRLLNNEDKSVAGILSNQVLKYIKSEKLYSKI